MPRGQQKKTKRSTFGGRNPASSYRAGVETIRRSPAIRLRWAEHKDKKYQGSFLYLRTDAAMPGWTRPGVSKSPASRLSGLVRQLHPARRGDHKMAYILRCENPYQVEQMLLLAFARRGVEGDWIKAAPKTIADRAFELTGLRMERYSKESSPTAYSAYKLPKRMRAKRKGESV